MALKYLHTNNIIHRDIKSANIFIDENNNIKLGDFGTIKIMKNYMMYATTQIGTPYYMGPEIYKCLRYTSKCDIWALGCVLYEMMTLTQPFTGHNINELKYRIIMGNYNKYALKNYSRDLQQIINSLLIVNPYNRASINDIFNIASIKSHIISLNLIQQDNFDINQIFMRI